jgi:hypothetical protein
VSPKLLEGASLDAPKIFGRAVARPSKLLLDATKFFRQCGSTALQKSHSPVASRYSLPFWLGRSLALPFLLGSKPDDFNHDGVSPKPRYWRAHLLMRRNSFGSAGALPSRKVIHQSPVAIRCRFGSAGASPSQFPCFSPRSKRITLRRPPSPQSPIQSRHWL